jgi:hypothetical protein
MKIDITKVQYFKVNLNYIQSCNSVSGQSGKFQVRKDNDHWEISTISGEWSNLPEDSSREMDNVYCRVIEIKDKVDGQMKEQKLCNISF